MSAATHTTSAEEIDAPFWQGLNKGELRMQRCTACGEWWWRPVWRCGECGGWDLEWPVVAPQGRVFSWSRAHQAFAADMQGRVPYVTLLVELPKAGGRRLMGLLVDTTDTPKIGDKVSGVFEAAANPGGQTLLRWRSQDW